VKQFIYILLLLAPIRLTAQECITSGASIENVSVNNEGNYILVNDDEAYPKASSKVFDAATGKLLYKYPQQNAGTQLEKFGFTEATISGFTGKNDSFFYVWCYNLDINYTNKKHFQNTGAAIEQFNFDNYNKKWHYRFTWPVNGAAAKTFEGFLIDGYYNLAENVGLLRVVAETKRPGDYVTTCYKLVKGQEPEKVSRSADFEINFMNMERITRNSMIYLPKHKQIISSFYGAVYDIDKNKVIEKNIFRVKNVYLGASLKGALVNEDETAIMFATYGGVTVLDLQSYKVLAEYKSGSSSDNNVRLPLAGFKNHILLTNYNGNFYFIKDGKELVLCDPDAAADEKEYDTWLTAENKKRKGSYVPANDPDVVTYETTVKAYNELLRELENSDSMLNPLLQKIMNSGKDAWILYKTREEAHKLLMRQADSIREFIKKYKAFITQNTLDSLYARLATTEQTNAKF
jgi:hypothetical protein